MQLFADVEVHLKVLQSYGETEGVWQKAELGCACYGFQTFQWQSAYMETIGAAEGAEPKIVHFTDAAGKSLMLLPLEIRRRFGLSVLSFLGGYPTDYHAPIICPIFAASLGPADCERLVACVLELLPRVDVIAFEKMPSTIEGVPNPFVRLNGAKHHRNSHVATLDRTFNDFKARRKSAFFRDSGRKKRRLEEVSPTSFTIAKSAEEAAAILPRLIMQKRQQYFRTGVTDRFAKPYYHAFYSSLGQKNWDTGLVHTSALYAGEELLAAHWGMVFRDRFYWILPSYDAGKWAKYSPGRLLTQFVVEWCISRDFKIFDLTIGDDEYKRHWADHVIPLYACTRGVTVKGKIYSWLCEFGDRAKQVAKRSQWLPSLVRKWRRSRRSTGSSRPSSAPPRVS